MPRSSLRHRHRRAGAGGRAQRPLSGARCSRTCRRSGCERFFVADGASYVVGEGSARHVHLLGAQPHSRPAVLAHRPRLLPQPADLPRRRAAGPGACRCSTMRCKPGGYLFLGTSENSRPARRSVRARRQEAPHLPAPRRRRAGCGCRCCSEPHGAGAARGARRAEPAPASRALRQYVEAQRARALRAGPCRGQRATATSSTTRRAPASIWRRRPARRAGRSWRWRARGCA